MQAEGNGHRLPVGDDRPRQALIGRREFSWHRDGEHAPVPAREEVRGLPHVGAARIDVIVRPDGHVERLAVIAIQVADEKDTAPVGIGEPPFKRTGDARAELPLRLAWQLLARSEVEGGADCRGRLRPAPREEPQRPGCGSV